MLNDKWLSSNGDFIYISTMQLFKPNYDKSTIIISDIGFSAWFPGLDSLSKTSFHVLLHNKFEKENP